jgi:hypothetical protein
MIGAEVEVCATAMTVEILHGGQRVVAQEAARANVIVTGDQ